MNSSNTSKSLLIICILASFSNIFCHVLTFITNTQLTMKHFIREKLAREVSLRESAEKRQKDYEERLRNMNLEVLERRKELEEAQNTIRRLEKQLSELQKAKDDLENKQKELEEMMVRLREAKELEEEEKAKLEEEIRLKQMEVERIRDEVNEKDEEARKLQVCRKICLILRLPVN